MPGWAVLGMVQAVVGDAQPEVFLASVPQRATLWWRHNRIDPGLGFQHCHLWGTGLQSSAFSRADPTRSVSSCAGTG